MVKFRRANLVRHPKTDPRRAESNLKQSWRVNGARKNQASADWARAEPGAGMQPVLNPKFIKIVKRLYLKFFALLYIDRAKRVCPA